MKNKSNNSTIAFAITGFLCGLLLNGVVILNYRGLKVLPQAVFYYFSHFYIILFSPVYLSLILGFIGFKRQKLFTFRRAGKAIAQVNEAIIITDLNKTVQWVNAGFVNIHGYSLKEIKGKNISEVLHGPLSNIDEGNSMMAKLLEGEPVVGDLLIYHKNGSPIWISASIKPIYDKGGSMEGFIAINKNISNRKAKELSIDALYSEIADYKFALDQSSSVIIFDIDGNIIRANNNFCTRYAVEESKIVGRNYSLINSSMADFSISKPIWNALQEGLTWKGEMITHSANDKIYWADTTIVPLLDKKGKPNHFLLIEKDITERKLLENQLEINNHKLQMAMQIALLGSWEIDINGIITLSEELRTIIHEPSDSAIDLAYLFARIPPKEVEMIEKNLVATRTTFERNDMEFQFLVHGEIHYLTTTNTAQFNKEGNFNGLFGTVQDITAFKLIELALKKSEEEKARAMQIAMIGAWDIDIDGVLTLSDELKSLIREPTEAQIDLPYVFERMLPEEVVIMQNNLTSTRTTFQKNDMEFQFLVHGEIHYFTSTNTAQFNRNGEFTGLFGTVQDVTAFKLIALALKKSEAEKAVTLNHS